MNAVLPYLSGYNPVVNLKAGLSRKLQLQLYVLTFPNAGFSELSVKNTWLYRQCATQREAAPRGKKWQERRAEESAGVGQPFDLDGTIFVPATLVTAHR
jgi:hypothetical protein